MKNISTSLREQSLERNCFLFKIKEEEELFLFFLLFYSHKLESNFKVSEKY